MHPFRGGITCSKNILEMYEVDREIHNIARLEKSFESYTVLKDSFPSEQTILYDYDISTVRIITRKAYRNRRNITNNFPSINHYRFLQGLFQTLEEAIHQDPGFDRFLRRAKAVHTAV